MGLLVLHTCSTSPIFSCLMWSRSVCTLPAGPAPPSPQAAKEVVGLPPLQPLTKAANEVAYTVRQGFGVWRRLLVRLILSGSTRGSRAKHCCNLLKDAEQRWRTR